MMTKGMKLYATSYQKKEEIQRQYANAGYNVTDVSYLGSYDGEPFEFLDQNFLDGDAIYLVKGGDAME